MLGTRISTPIAGPAAWRGSDFPSPESYVTLLGAEELGEIDRAIAALGGGVERWRELEKRDFPFERLARRLEAVVDELEDGRGFVLLRGIPVRKYSREQLRALFWGMGLYVGKPVCQNGRGDLIGTITDVGKDIGDTNIRGAYTNAGLAAHGDCAEAIALMCLRASKSGGESIIASTVTIYNEILERHPEYLDLLHEGFIYDVRGENGNLDEVSRGLVPVYTYYDGKLSCNFNPRAILSAQKKTGRPLPPLALEAIEYISAAAMRPGLRLDMDFHPGDIQFLNSYLTLHARNDYVDFDDPDEKRFLYRLWLSLFRRNLPPGWGDRYNSGGIVNGILPRR